jgi:hypothetical protein
VELAHAGYGLTLEPTWGYSLDEISKAEAHPGLGNGVRFPRLLREWFRLVGRRGEDHEGRRAGRWMHKLAGLDCLTPYHPPEGGGYREGVTFWSASSRGVKWVVPLNDEGDPPVNCHDLHQLVVGADTTPLRLSECLQVWLIAETEAASVPSGVDLKGPLGEVAELKPGQAAEWLGALFGERVTLDSYRDWLASHRPEDHEAAEREALENAAALLGVTPPAQEPAEDAEDLDRLLLDDAVALYEAGRTKRAIVKVQRLSRSLEGPLAKRAKELLKSWEAE